MTTSLTLYEINDTLAALVDSLDMCETDEQRAECEAEIQRTVEAQVRKVDDFCRFLAHLDAQETLAKAEIERLRQRKDRITSLRDRLEHYAVRVMETAGITKLDGDTATMRLRRNPPSVEIVDLDVVPAQYKTIVTEVRPDKRAIGAALKANEDVPGADLRFGAMSLVRK